MMLVIAIFGAYAWYFWNEISRGELAASLTLFALSFAAYIFSHLKGLENKKPYVLIAHFVLIGLFAVICSLVLGVQYSTHGAVLLGGSSLLYAFAVEQEGEE